MSNKKFPKLAVLSVLGLLALTSCDSSSSSEIYAKPSTYDDAVISITESGEKASIHNNVLKLIYDAMHEGSASSKVLDQVLGTYAETIFGVYNPVIAKKERVKEEDPLPITLKEAAEDATTTSKTKVYPFIRSHKVYWLFNENGEHVDDEGTVVPEGDDWTPCQTELINVVSMYNNINDLVAKVMYDKAVNGSATSNHVLDEWEFVKSLYKEGKKVDWATVEPLGAVSYDDVEHKWVRDLPKVFVDYTVEEEDVFDGLLHKEYYTGKDGVTYIEDEIIPSVYNDLLIQRYLLDEELSAVRSSRARKINVLKIEKYSGSSLNADKLVANLVDDIYKVAPEDNGHVRQNVDDIEDELTKLFKVYSNVSKGLYNNFTQAEKDVVDAIDGDSGVYEKHTYTYEGVDYVYYDGTAYGDLIKDFEKFHKGSTYDDFNKSLYDKFTYNGTVSELEGLSRLTLEISQQETITNGWFLEKAKPTLDGNGKINERLFTLSIAERKYEVGGEKVEPDPLDPSKDIDYSEGSDPQLIAANLEKLENVDRFEKHYTNEEKTTWEWTLRDSAAEGENKYLCSINGAYFLKKERRYPGESYKNDIVFDDGNAYYIVNVLEAVNDVKLRSKGDYSYSKLRGTRILNEITAEVSKKVAETGSYASLAKEYWLEKMNLTYHDQKVYDYFKSNYPDLFE